MKLDYALKHFKFILWGISVAFLAQIFFATDIYAQQRTLSDTDRADLDASAQAAAADKERIEQLVVSLEVVGQAINSATNLNRNDRLLLLMQLVELSRTIMVLEGGVALAAVEQREIAERDSDAAQIISLQDTGLHRVKVLLDIEDFTAEITEYYLSEADDFAEDPFGVEYDLVERTIRLNPLDPNASFKDKVNFAEDQVVELFMDEVGYSNESELRRVIFMSAQNEKKLGFGPGLNSPDALELEDDFGERNIITRIELMGGERAGRIIAYSDRGDRMEMIFTRSRGNIKTSNYSLDIEYFRNVSIESPSVTFTLGDMKAYEMFEISAMLFEGIPFADELEDPHVTFLSFLTDNDAYWIGLERHSSNCVSAIDEVVLNDFTLQILNALEANYIMGEFSISYPVREEFTNDDDGPSSRCFSVEAFF